jgi:putative ABC transport system ATP-binding protein
MHASNNQRATTIHLVAPSTQSASPMLDTYRLRKLFHAGTPDERVAIDDVSLTLKRGDFAVVVGGNGAGKSTLLNMIAGEVIPDSGLIRIDNEDITRLPTHKRARHISRVFQDPSVGTAASLSIEENLSVAARRGLPRTFGRGLSSHLVLVFSPAGSVKRCLC